MLRAGELTKVAQPVQSKGKTTKVDQARETLSFKKPEGSEACLHPG